MKKSVSIPRSLTVLPRRPGLVFPFRAPLLASCAAVTATPLQVPAAADNCLLYRSADLWQPPSCRCLGRTAVNPLVLPRMQLC